MALNKKAFALTAGIMWAACMFILTLVSLYTGYATGIMNALAGIYPGYTISLVGSIVGLVYGFIDAFIGLYIFAWLYNLLEKKLK
ncbi:bacteriophage holin [Nanoarchaeota archaeon]